MTPFDGQSREQLRSAYREAWRRRLAGLPLRPLEAQLADIIAAHPEYQALITEQDSLQRDFSTSGGESNPYLHLGLHLALREQIGTDRPAGIAAVHRQLLARAADAHVVEHRMMEVLAQMLAEAQRTTRPPQEALYLDRLRRL
ncbi:MAG TPA: DUF1841 family protein [Steroidobacteraceae bacterium]|jgi:hypothetical protein